MSLTFLGSGQSRTVLILSFDITKPSGVTQVFHSIGMEFAFISPSKEPMLPETSEYFLDMFLVFLGVIGIDKDVVEIDHDVDVE